MCIYVRHDIILQHVSTCFDIFMKMQGRHKKLLLGSLRANRAIKNEMKGIGAGVLKYQKQILNQ